MYLVQFCFSIAKKAGHLPGFKKNENYRVVLNYFKFRFTSSFHLLSNSSSLVIWFLSSLL